jgi:CheY-like chemotaxis protein
MRGSGLGLSVVHGIIEDHNGYVTVDTKVGQSTNFSLYFPIARDLPSPKNDAIPRARGTDESILIVDDDPIQRKVAGQLLKRLGYRVASVPSGEEAVKQLKQTPYDLLILDMMMEGIDGAETYRQVLEFRPAQKAIIMSGFAMTKRVEETLRLGANQFIPKPLILETFAKDVRKVLDNVLDKTVRH